MKQQDCFNNPVVQICDRLSNKFHQVCSCAMYSYLIITLFPLTMYKPGTNALLNLRPEKS